MSHFAKKKTVVHITQLVLLNLESSKLSGSKPWFLTPGGPSGKVTLNRFPRALRTEQDKGPQDCLSGFRM